MSVKGIELAIGQKWTTLGYGVVTIEPIYDSQVYAWRCVNKDYRFSVTSDGKYWEDDESTVLLECIYDPNQIKQPTQVLSEKQFNPKPGDKIICNNGEEFTCCTKKFLDQKRCAVGGYKDDSVFAYRNDSENYTTGVCWVCPSETNNIDWHIREVIPQRKYEAPSKAEPIYSAEDIRKAFITDLGWLEYSFGLLIESLEKVKNPEYMEYLRLKAMFESEQQEL